MILDYFTALVGSLSATNAMVGQLVTSLGTTKSVNVLDTAPQVTPASQTSAPNTNSLLRLTVTLMQALTSAGAATVRFALIQADDAALTTNVQVLNQTDDLAYTLLTQGKQLSMRAGAALVNRRYLGVLITVGGAVLTNASGQFFGALSLEQINPGTTFKSGYSLQ